MIRTRMLGWMLLGLAVMSSPAWAQEAPDALVKRVVRRSHRRDPGRQGSAGRQPGQGQTGYRDQARPQFRFHAHDRPGDGTQLAHCHARSSRSSSPTSFGRCWCARTPARLANYRDNTMDYKPLRMNPGDTEVTVRTEVRRPGQAPVQIDYSMEKTPDGWKAYDVIVAGVSLVTNYRDEFNDTIKSLRHRRTDRDAGQEERRRRRRRRSERRACASTGRRRPRCRCAGDRWAVSAAMTMDTVAPLLDASKALATPQAGVVDLGQVQRVDSAGGRAAAGVEAPRRRGGQDAAIHARTAEHDVACPALWCRGNAYFVTIAQYRARIGYTFAINLSQNPPRATPSSAQAVGPRNQFVIGL